MSGVHDRIHAGAAQAIHGRARHFHRQSGEQGGHASHVTVVLACLVSCAQDDVVDESRVDAIALDDRPNHVRGEVIGPHTRQRTPVAPERRAQAVYDDRCAAWIARGGRAHPSPDASTAGTIGLSGAIGPNETYGRVPSGAIWP